MFGISGDNLKLIKTGLEYTSARQKSEAERGSADFEANRLLENAKARLAKGVRTARRDREAGDVMESDTIAAMAGQGSTIDPVMIAKIKAKTNYNSMAALLDAHSEHDDLVQQSLEVRAAGQLSHSANMFAAKTNMLSGLMKSGVGNSFTDWMKNKPTTKWGASNYRRG